MMNNQTQSPDIYAYLYTYRQYGNPLSKLTREEFIHHSVADRKLIGKVLYFASEPINNSYPEATLFSLKIELPLHNLPSSNDSQCIIVRKDDMWGFYPRARLIDKSFNKDDNTAYFKFVVTSCNLSDERIKSIIQTLSDSEMRDIELATAERFKELLEKSEHLVQRLQKQSNELAVLLDELKSINYEQNDSA